MLTHLRVAGRQLAERVPAPVRFKIYCATAIAGGALVAAGRFTDTEVAPAIEVVAEILAIGAPVLAAGNVPRSEA